jgi:hypothetical protein
MEQHPGPAPIPLLQPEPQPEPMLAPMPARDDGAGRLSPAALFGLGTGGLFLIGVLAAGAISFSLSRPDPAGPSLATADRGAPAQTAPAASNPMFQPVAAGETEQAIDALIMPAPQKDAVRQALRRNALRIAWINLSDSEAEDGDWVMVTAGAFSQNVRLFKNPLRVAVPYVPGAPVAVTGLIDGDGHGITVAVHSGASTFNLKSLVKGETIQVPSP